MRALNPRRKPAALAFALIIALVSAALFGSDSAYADADAPSAIAIASDAGADKFYATGNDITVRVTFPQTIAAVTGAELTIQIGERERTATANNCSSSCGTTLDFSYTVQLNDHDANGVTVSPDALSANALTHQHGSDAAHPFSATLPDTLASPQADHRVNLGDYDQDNDGLIEVSTLAHLNAIRWDLDGDGGVSATDATNYSNAFLSRDSDMGCPTTTADVDNNDCLGYELDADLDFDTDGDGATYAISESNAITGDSDDAYYNSNAGFDRIGRDLAGSRYNAKFKGNGHSISNLYMNNSSIGDFGLFGATGGDARIESVALLNAFVRGNNFVGALAGTNRGIIHTSYSTGEVRGSAQVGGLVGLITAGSGGEGTVVACYSAAKADGGSSNSVGGLIGEMRGAGSNIRASYSIGEVLTTSSTAPRGVLGHIDQTASATRITGAYWDTETSGIADDADLDMPEGRTTSVLSSPTSASGIYTDWDDIDLSDDGLSNPVDDPWDFGNAGSYPVLSWGGFAADDQRVDYDADDDGLIGISNLAQLNAVRHDLDGDGDADATTNDAAYYGAFANAQSYMGCPPDEEDADNYDCAGFELLEDLDFDTDENGVVDNDDDYPNWTPIGGNYSAGRFDGNGKTISNLKIDTSTVAIVGLFSTLLRTTVSNLGLLDADISTSASGARAGALAGRANGLTVRSVYATGAVSETSTASGFQSGGIIGYGISADFYGSWSGVSVSSSGSSVETGGLLGTMQSGTIVASYATGPVSATGSNSDAGGLSGAIQGATVTASYATGPVAASGTNSNSGGLYGRTYQTNTITASYWDTGTTGIADDSDNNMPEGVTTRELQSVTSATGVFADWDDLTVDADGTNDDDPWDFGGIWAYPVLDFGALTPEMQRGEARIRVDSWEIPVIGEVIHAWLRGGPSLRAEQTMTNNGCLAGAGMWKQPWIWQYSTDGGLTWTDEPNTDAARGGDCTFQFVPQSADANRLYRAKVSLAAGGQAITPIVGKVSSSAPSATTATASFASGHAAPTVGTRIYLSGLAAGTGRPTGATLHKAWRFERCDDNTATPAGCEVVGLPSPDASYAPEADDVSHYIRAFTYYQSSAGVWTRAETPFTTAAVVAASN